MTETKLIEILKTFSKDEWKLFEKFAASPFFNNGRSYLPLLKQLQKYYPEFESKKLTYENIYKKIYPGRQFNKQVMWNLVSELEKLSREFILQLAFRENKLERFIMTFDELLKRNLDKQNLKEINMFEKNLESEKMGPGYFYALRIMEDNKSEYWHTVMGRQDRSYESIVNVTEYFFLNFLCESSSQVWDLHILKKMYNPGERTAASYDFFKTIDFKKIAEYAEDKGYKYAPVLRFYYNKIMCALDEGDEIYFTEMKEFFEANSSLFDFKEQNNTIVTLANYCANKMRLGNEYYFRVLFDINKMRLEKGIGTQGNRKINKALYHQVVRNALALNEIEWAEKFIKEYTPKLVQEVQKTMKALALGYLYFVKEDYRKALSHINNVEFIDVRDKLHVRILSAKSYYQLDETELLMHYIDSSRHFISSTEAIDEETREAYLGFFKHIEKLTLCKARSDNTALEKLKINAENDKSLRLRHKNWFLEKIHEIQNPGIKPVLRKLAHQL